ncbi:PSD1 and planctomycete cytochrome C domain-containing protein [Limnoglobus roseus]|nr:PSD1 and planctomycete cytochrome C domain-containing protein [Limnoglobus roseus]
MRWLSCLAILVLANAGRAADPKIDTEHFEKTVRPLLVARCQKCHNGEKTKGGLDLSTKTGFLTGGDTGPSFDKQHPEKSKLLDVVRYDGEMKMPPSGKLPEAEIAILTAWVKADAPWPDDKGTVAVGPKGFDVQALAAKHWSFQPIKLGDGRSIDDYIRAKLSEAKLPPAKPAEPGKLLRRVTFDLIGLPPSPEEIEAFQKAYSRDPKAAFAEVVDRLLASPRYGERWGRHWLDLARYAETRGHEFDFEIPDAWRYRDYVIRAFNDNLPYDRFVQEQMAGDLLPPRWNAKERWNEALIATGFWHLGEGVHSPVDVRLDEANRVDNQIDVFGKTFLGLTVSCSRCHDHKFDPIPTADYYSLYGILGSSRYSHCSIDDPAEKEAVLKELTALRPQPPAEPFPKGEPTAWEKQSRLFEDFHAGWQDRWFATGPAFRTGEAYPHSGRESANLTGALRSPTFKIDSKYLSVRVAGKKAQLRLILNNLQLIQDPIYGGLKRTIDHGDRFLWATFDLSMWPGQAAYLELLDDGPGYAAIKEVRFADSHPPTNEPNESCSLPPTVPQDNSRIAQLEAKLAAPPRRAPVMFDGNGLNENIFIRGGHKTPGPAVERRFLEVFAGKDAKSPSTGSGRLQLAESLTDMKNPLVARVFVNRVWQHHFGVGLVASPDDFGKQGQPPTHPELLDALAAEFIRDGWNVKNLHRRVLLTATYQQSATPDPTTAALAATVDPLNKLLHRANVQRLEAEAIRDAMLSVSGRLDPTMGGPGVLPHLTEFEVGRGKPGGHGPVDGNGRRSVYLQVRRNFINPFFSAFDYPTPFTAIGRRSVSNVPAQALSMLNNPFVVAEAERWAKTTLKQPNQTPAERVDRMYREAFGRAVTADERAAAVAFVGEQSTSLGEPRAWAELAHALFNAKEFLFIE